MTDKSRLILISFLALALVPLASVAKIINRNGDQILDTKLFADGMTSDSANTMFLKVNQGISLPDDSLDISLFGNGVQNSQGFIPVVRNEQLLLEPPPSNNKFIDGSINSALITDGNLTTNKFEDGVITNSKIQDTSIAGSHIQNTSINSAKIIDNSIAAAQINTGFLDNIQLAGFPQNESKPISNSSTVLDVISNLNFRNNANFSELATILAANPSSLPGSTVIDGSLTINGNATVDPSKQISANSINGPSSGAQLADNIAITGGPNSILYQVADNQTAASASSTFAENKVLGMNPISQEPQWKALSLRMSNTLTDTAGQNCESVCASRFRGACVSARCTGSSISASCRTFHDRCGASRPPTGAVRCTCVEAIAQ